MTGGVLAKSEPVKLLGVKALDDKSNMNEIHLNERPVIKGGLTAQGSRMRDEDLDFPNNGDIPPAIPNGDHYALAFIRAEEKYLWGQHKLFLWFEIVTPGDCVGVHLFMACTIPRKGRWTAACKFWRAWVLAAGKRPQRTDRMSTRVFRNKYFRGRVRKVTKSSKQIPLTPDQQYSVIDELLEVTAGR